MVGVRKIQESVLLAWLQRLVAKVDNNLPEYNVTKRSEYSIPFTMKFWTYSSCLVGLSLCEAFLLPTTNKASDSVSSSLKAERSTLDEARRSAIASSVGLGLLSLFPTTSIAADSKVSIGKKH
jgi:hypothetical protein